MRIRAATDKIAEAGIQDLVILGMKAQQVSAVVKRPAGDVRRRTPSC